MKPDEVTSSLETVDLVGIGLNATDTLLIVDEFPPYAGKVPLKEELMSPGGQVATAVVTCAKLGLKTRYIGTIGDDIRGNIQRESLEGTGVDTSGLLVREGAPNQTGFIIIDTRTGERTVLWQRVDALRLQRSDLKIEHILSSRMLHIDGYDTDAAAYAAGIAQGHGIPVSLDVDTVYPDFEQVLKRVDILVASSTWPRKWTGEADVFKALRLLQAEYRFEVASMTLGQYGSLFLKGGNWEYSPAFEVHCVDTTGAGDVFHGALCYAMLQGMDSHAALEFANAAAAINCTAIGARGHIPTISEVESLLAQGTRGSVKRRRSDEIEERLAEANSLASAAKR
jgi:sulfofructose kinase